MLDVAVRCNTAFFDKVANALCEDRVDIVQRYFSSGALAVDLVALLPLDLVTHPARTSLVVVVLRVLRLLKLGRIRTLARLDTLLLDGVRARSGHLRLARFLCMTCLLSHLMACGLHLVAVFQRGQGTCTWINHYHNLLRPGAQPHYDGLICGPMDDPPTTSSLYLAALVWSMETMTTVGYGDVVAVTDAEHAYVVCAMLVGGAFFSYVVGNFVSVVAELSQVERQADRTMDTLNDFVASAALEPMLAARLRRYVRLQLESDAAGPGAGLHTLLDGMSPLLRNDVALSTNAVLYARLPLFTSAPLLLLIELSFAFKPMSFPPGEELCRAGQDARHGLVITLLRGMVRVVDPLADPDVLPHGLIVSTWIRPKMAAELLIGEEALWAAAFPGSMAMQRIGATVLSVTNASCMSVRAKELAALLAQFPDYVAALRVPVRARWLRRRLRLVMEGTRRVSTLLTATRRLRSGAAGGCGFTDLVEAVVKTTGVEMMRRGTTRRLQPTRRLNNLEEVVTQAMAAQPGRRPMRSSTSTLPKGNARDAEQLTQQFAVFVVSCAAPKLFADFVAAALTIQRIFRGSLVRERLRQRIVRARHSTRAMQRLASKLAGKEPAVVALETLRLVHKQLLNAMEQQEQVVSESMERTAVARERKRISQIGLASQRAGAMVSAPVAFSGTGMTEASVTDESDLGEARH